MKIACTRFIFFHILLWFFKVLLLLPRRNGRVVECTGLENQRTERYRGFESLFLRQKKELRLARLFFLTIHLRNNYYKALSIISSTTEGSNRVEVSPKLVLSPSAIFRRILRMIFPDLVLGRPETN